MANGSGSGRRWVDVHVKYLIDRVTVRTKLRKRRYSITKFSFKFYKIFTHIFWQKILLWKICKILSFVWMCTARSFTYKDNNGTICRVTLAADYNEAEVRTWSTPPRTKDGWHFKIWNHILAGTSSKLIRISREYCEFDSIISEILWQFYKIISWGSSFMKFDSMFW